MSTPALQAALRERYKAPEWALMFEVGDATGFNVRRHADAVAMSLWPSRGLAVHGFEIKASRGDWKRELQNPEKAEAVWRYCDFWWIVTTANVVQMGELPPTWGHLELTAKGLRCVVQAPKLKKPGEDKHLTRSFIAAMLRRASESDDSVINAIVEARVRDVRNRLEEQFMNRLERDRGPAMAAAKEVEDKVAEIERLTGINLNAYTPTETVARAIKAAMKADIVGNGYRSGLNSLETTVASFLAQVKRHRAILTGEENAEAHPD